MNRREFLKDAALASALTMLPLGSIAQAADQKQLYYMITFVSGIEYWKDCFRGMQDAAAYLGCDVKYTGTPENDITAEVRVMDEVSGTKPDGILVTACNPDGMAPAIDTAMDAGVHVISFDADSPKSKRYAYVGISNYDSGVVAARWLGPKLKEGKVAISSVTAQLNHLERRNGFLDTIKAEFPKIIFTPDMMVDDQNNSTNAAVGMSAVLQANPDVKGIFATDALGAVGICQSVRESGRKDILTIGFDYDEGTLDLIDKGDLGATLAQGTWHMGFWGMLGLWMVRNGHIKSVSDWKAANISPMPPSILTGVAIIDKNNSKFWRKGK